MGVWCLYARLPVADALKVASRNFNASLPPAAQQRVGMCNTSGSGTDLPDQSGDVVETHGPLPQNASLFMGFAFMMTASCESDRLSNRLSSDEDEGSQPRAHRAASL